MVVWSGRYDEVQSILVHIFSNRITSISQGCESRTTTAPPPLSSRESIRIVTCRSAASFKGVSISKFQASSTSSSPSTYLGVSRAHQERSCEASMIDSQLVRQAADDDQRLVYQPVRVCFLTEVICVDFDTASHRCRQSGLAFSRSTNDADQSPPCADTFNAV